MISRDKEEFFIQCDDCDTRYYGGTIDNFYTFLADAKKHGWVVTGSKQTGYNHRCPDCVKSK